MGLQQEIEPVAPEPTRAAADCVAALERHPLFRTIFEHAPLAQLVCSPDGTIERVNPAFSALLGYAPGEVCGKSVMDITHPDDVAKSWSSNRRVGSSLPRLSFQKRYLHKNGRLVSALVTLSAIELDDCRMIVRQIVDLTAIKQAHSEAHDAHDRLQTALEGAEAGTWEIDVVTGHIEWDEVLRRRFGLAEHEATPSLDAWVASIHEDDRPSVKAALRNATMPGHGRFDHEFRVHCADDVTRWYRCVGRVRRDEPGRAPRAIGIAIDITRAKQAQLDRERMQSALHRAERRVAAIVENSHDAIILTDLNYRVVSWNAAAEALLGYTEAEAMGMSVLSLIAPDRPFDLGKQLAALRSGQPLRNLEAIGRRKDGSTVFGEMTVSPVPGEDGKTAWYAGFIRDITERKVAERRLREQQRRLEEIANTVSQVLWTADPINGRLLYVSPGYEQMFGRSCESLYADPYSWRESIHPDDRATLKGAREAYEKGTDFVAHYRVVRPDGTIRRVWDRGYPVRDANGAVMHYVGAAVDVTDMPEQGIPPAR
jgi:PAS domain S-box-containing protein